MLLARTNYVKNDSDEKQHHLLSWLLSMAMVYFWWPWLYNTRTCHPRNCYITWRVFLHFKGTFIKGTCIHYNIYNYIKEHESL